MTSAKGRHERAIAIHKALPLNEDGTTKIVEIVFESPPEVILRLGLFFDGTANNADNTRLRKEYQQELIHNPDAATDLPVYDPSYENEYTNIHRLYEMYHVDEKLDLTPHEDGNCYYQKRIYIDGVGTKKGKSDSIIACGISLFSRGMLAKLAKGISEIGRVIEEFKTDNPGIRIKGIEYEVFGFSRGAATARLFAKLVSDPEYIIDLQLDNEYAVLGIKMSDIKKNLSSLLAHGFIFMGGKFPNLNLKQSKALLQESIMYSFGERNPLTQILRNTLENIQVGNWTRTSNGHLRFLGLFDTVTKILKPLAAIGNRMSNSEVDFSLDKTMAEHGIQIAAQHEYREHFPLDDVPDSFTRLTLPGSHSDIGGGYSHLPHEEIACVSKIIVDIYLSQSEKEVEKEVEKYLEEHLLILQNHPTVGSLFRNLNKHCFDISTNPILDIRPNIPILHDVRPNIQGSITLTREIKPKLDTIALRVMYNEAVMRGCRFIEFDEQFCPPQELNSLATAIFSHASMQKNYNLTDEEGCLVSDYIHCSVNYERIEIETTKPRYVEDLMTKEIKVINWKVKVPYPKSPFIPFQTYAPNEVGGIWTRRIRRN